MTIFRNIAAWLSARRPRPLDQLLKVEYDDIEVRVRVLDRLEPDWNQSFKWSDVVRVCFHDAGLYSSDVIIIEIADRARPVAILTEAHGGGDFFNALSARGFFPDEVWRNAFGDTSGGEHCWPPRALGS